MARSLRLAFFGRTMPAHRGGRGMFHPYLVARSLAGRGHEVTILTTAHPSGVLRECPVPRVEVLYLEGAAPDRYSEEYFTASAAEFDRLHGLRPFDAAWSDSAGAAGFVRHSRYRGRVPLVAACHAGLTMMTDPSRDFFATTQHGLLTHAAAIIAVSRRVAESIVDGLPAAAGKVRVIRNGADPALYANEGTTKSGGQACPERQACHPDPLRTSDSLRASLGLDHRPVLLYLGRIVPEKGPADLIRAASMVPAPGAQVVIVGPGPYGEELRAEARSLGVSLTLVPGVPHGDTARYLAMADLFILPTQHQEGLPFVLVEAMLARRPIIASDIGGVPEIVRHEQTGLLTPARDVPALAAAITRLLCDRALRERLADAGHDLAVREHSLDSMIGAVEGLLGEVVGAWNGTGAVAVRRRGALAAA